MKGVLKTAVLQKIAKFLRTHKWLVTESSLKKAKGLKPATLPKNNIVMSIFLQVLQNYVIM